MNGHVTVPGEHSPAEDAMLRGLRFAILLDISGLFFFFSKDGF